MKKAILLLIIILAGTLVIYSQVPQAMTYKAIAKDDWGVSLPNKAITLRFSILEGSEFGLPVYVEVHSTVTNKFGLMDVQIGKGIAKQGNFSNINWSTGTYYIKIEMDPKGGSDFRLEDPAHQLLSVPYALYAGNSGNAFSGNYNDLYNKPTNLSQFNNNMGFISNETDPAFSISPAHGITSGNINNWNTAFSWGGHAGLYKPSDYVPAWTEVKEKPTTLSGYGITDAINTSHAANGITSTLITNWNAAFEWGNHSGLYKPLSYLPAWSEISGNPFNITSPTADQLLRYNSSSNQWENWTPGYLTSEVDGSVTNEIQDLTLTDDKLKITNNTVATEIDLAPYKADGSETKVISGNNVTIEGTGTETSPYIISSAGGEGNSTLSQILVNGNSAEGKNIKNLASPIDKDDAVTKAYVDALLGRVENLEGLLNGTRIADGDGNIYKTIKIGEQVWMAENLYTTKLNDGTPLVLATTDREWIELGNVKELELVERQGFCWYNFDTQNKAIYGGLYNADAVRNVKLCPTGWSLPNSTDWNILITYIGGLRSGGKIMEKGNEHWIHTDPNRVTNETGFTALPGGFIGDDGIFHELGRTASWWYGSSGNLEMNEMGDIRTRSVIYLQLDGFSVRCIKN
jgi:uncharacterized protein (TIGR02145 family)